VFDVSKPTIIVTNTKKFKFGSDLQGSGKWTTGVQYATRSMEPTAS
jgi:hypothetical protein